MGLVLFSASVNCFTLVFDGELEGHLIGSLSSNVALSNMNLFASAFGIVIRGEIGLCLGVENKVIAKGWNRDSVRFESTKFL